MEKPPWMVYASTKFMSKHTNLLCLITRPVCVLSSLASTKLRVTRCEIVWFMRQPSLCQNIPICVLSSLAQLHHRTSFLLILAYRIGFPFIDQSCIRTSSSVLFPLFTLPNIPQRNNKTPNFQTISHTKHITVAGGASRGARYIRHMDKMF